MCSCILTEGDNLIARSNILPARIEHMNNSYKLESHQLKGSPENDPIVHNMDELSDQGEYHPGVRLFHPHQYIINLQVKLVTESRNGNNSYKTGIIKERISKYDYRIESHNGKH